MTYIADDEYAAIAENGELITLRRLAPRGIRFDVDCMAMVRAFRPNELLADIKQGDRQVIISNREIAKKLWPGPPVAGDQVIVAGRTSTLTINPATIRVGSEIVRHTMQVRG